MLGPDADDVEWYFTPDDLLVQFRAERRSGGADFGANRRRLEDGESTGEVGIETGGFGEDFWKFLGISWKFRCFW